VIKTEIFTRMEGTVWEGKLDHVPRVGEEVFVNNKKRHGYYTVEHISWRVDEKKVFLRVREQS
jgi:hypothetical protein